MAQAQKFRRFAIPITGIALVITSTACGYDVSFNDCQVTCQMGTDCPDGFSCQAGLCRSPGMTGACGTPGTVTLRQTGDDKIDKNLEFACTNADTTTAQTSWYRVFSLSENGISGDFNVDKVTVGISLAVGMPSAGVSVGTYGGQLNAAMLDPTKIVQLGAGTAMVDPTGIGALVGVPITAKIPGGSNLIVEIDIADQNGTGNQINIASTDASETHAAYLRAPKCGQNTPTTTTSAGLSGASFILTVEGSGN